MTYSRVWSISYIYGIKKSCLSVQRTGYGKKGLLHFIHLWDKITFIWATFIGKKRSCLSVQLTGDAEQGLVHFISYIYGIKMFIWSTYRWWKAGPGPFHTFMGTKLDIPSKSYLSLQRTGDAKQNHKMSHKNHVYLLNVKVTQSKIIFICATYRWRIEGLGPFHTFLG